MESGLLAAATVELDDVVGIKPGSIQSMQRISSVVKTVEIHAVLQALQIALNMQHGFSWRTLLTDALEAGVNDVLNPAFKDANAHWESRLASDIAYEVADDMLAATVNKQHLTAELVAARILGTFLGQELVTETQRAYHQLQARRDEKPYQRQLQQQISKAEDAWWKEGVDAFIAKQEGDSTLAYARYQTDFWQPATGGNRQTSNARQQSTYTNAMSKDWSRVGQQDDDHLDNQFNQPPTPQAPRPTYAQREGQQQEANQTSQTDKLWQQGLAQKKAEYNSDIQLSTSKLGFFGPAPSSSTEDDQSLTSVAHTTGSLRFFNSKPKLIPSSYKTSNWTSVMDIWPASIGIEVMGVKAVMDYVPNAVSWMKGYISQHGSVGMDVSIGFGLAMDLELGFSKKGVTTFFGAGLGIGYDFSVSGNYDFQHTQGWTSKTSLHASLGATPVQLGGSFMVSPQIGGTAYSVGGQIGEGLEIDTVVGYSSTYSWDDVDVLTKKMEP